MEPEERIEEQERTRFPAAFAAGLVVIAIIAGIVVLASHFIKTPQQQSALTPLPFGGPEQAYASQIRFENLELSQSDNLINQKFTYVAGTVSNRGPHAVEAIEVSVEFHDPFKQVVLKDTLRPIRRTDSPLRAGEQRDFNLAIDQGLPSTWDQQYPSIRITGLLLE